MWDPSMGGLMTLAAEQFCPSLSLSFSLCPGAVWFYSTTFMDDRNGWVQLKTNGKPIKCKGYPGRRPIRGPTTRFTYGSQRRDIAYYVLNANEANFLF